jgi:putative intracellular protease/amidase
LEIRRRQVDEGAHLRRQVARAGEYRVHRHLGRSPVRQHALQEGRLASPLDHGCAILAYAKDSQGQSIARGRTGIGFANVEEDFADNAVWSCGLLPRDKHVMPWRIEDRLMAPGANCVQGGLWRSFAVRDGNLVTGQQNFPGGETARLVIEALGRRHRRWR